MSARSLELQLSEQVSVFGEVHEAPAAHGCVLLLHDRGGDLDALRPYAAPLATVGLTTVLVDMPGHGLSAGDWDEDGADAVRLALDECRRQHPLVAAVAAGQACSLLQAVQPAPVRAAALVAPRLQASDLAAAPAWRMVPTITLGDPCDLATAASMEVIARWIRAWSLRMSVHYLDPPDGGPGRWTPHMTQSAAAFVAEQLAYAARSREPDPASPPRTGDARRPA